MNSVLHSKNDNFKFEWGQTKSMYTEVINKTVALRFFFKVSLQKVVCMSGLALVKSIISKLKHGILHSF